MGIRGYRDQKNINVDIKEINVTSIGLKTRKDLMLRDEGRDS